MGIRFDKVSNPDDLKEKGGAPIKLVTPLKTAKVTTTDRWFHGAIKGKDCEKMLKEHGELGSFLVRIIVCDLWFFLFVCFFSCVCTRI